MDVRGEVKAMLTTKVLWIVDEASSLPEQGLPLHPSLRYTIARGASEGLEFLRAEDFEAVLASFPLLEWTPEVLLEEIQGLHCSPHVVVHSPDITIKDAVRLTKLGAFQIVQNDGGVGSALLQAANCRRAREASSPGVPASEA